MASISEITALLDPFQWVEVRHTDMYDGHEECDYLGIVNAMPTYDETAMHIQLFLAGDGEPALRIWW